MPAPIEIGDIVTTDDGMKMVVNIFKNLDTRQICCQCVDTDDDPNLGDVMPVRKTYLKSQVCLVENPIRYSV